MKRYLVISLLIIFLTYIFLLIGNAKNDGVENVKHQLEIIKDPLHPEHWSKGTSVSVIGALVQFNDPEISKFITENVVEVLIKLMWDEKENHDMKSTTAVALGDIGRFTKDERIFNTFVELLKHPKLMQYGGDGLQFLKDKRGVDPLLEALKDYPDEMAGVSIVMALDHIGDPKAIDPLLGIIKIDKNWRVRNDAVLAFKHTFKPDAKIITVLEDALHDEYWLIRKNAAEALKKATGKDYEFDRTGEPRSHDELLRIIADHENSREGRERNTALLELIKHYSPLTDKRSIAVLEYVLKKDDYWLVRKNAAAVLKKATGKDYEYDKTGEPAD